MKLKNFKLLLRMLTVSILCLQMFSMYSHTYRFCNMSSSTVTVAPDLWGLFSNPDPVTLTVGQSYDFSTDRDIKGACIASGSSSVSSCGDGDKNFIKSSHSSSHSFNLTQESDGTWKLDAEDLATCTPPVSSQAIATSTNSTAPGVGVVMPGPACSVSALQIPAGTPNFTYTCLPQNVVEISYTPPTLSGITPTVSPTTYRAYVPFEYFSGANNAVEQIGTADGQIYVVYNDTKFIKDTNPADDISNLSYRFHNAVNTTGCTGCTAYRLLSPVDSTTKLGGVISCTCGATKTNVIIPALLWSNTNPTQVQAINNQLIAHYVT